MFELTAQPHVCTKRVESYPLIRHCTSTQFSSTCIYSNFHFFFMYVLVFTLIFQVSTSTQCFKNRLLSGKNSFKVCQEFNFSNQECFLNGCNYFSLCSILIRLVILFLLAILFYISILSYKTDKVHRNASYKAEATTFSLFSCYFPEEARHVALVYYLLRTTTELTFHRRPARQLR